MACELDTSSEIVGWEAGARTCLHVRPGRLTMLECRFNKTRHHPKFPRGGGLSGACSACVAGYATGPHISAAFIASSSTSAWLLSQSSQEWVAARSQLPCGARLRARLSASSRTRFHHPTPACGRGWGRQGVTTRGGAIPAPCTRVQRMRQAGWRRLNGEPCCLCCRPGQLLSRGTQARARGVRTRRKRCPLSHLRSSISR